MALLDENGFGLTGSFLFTAAQILLVVLLSELHFFSPLGAGGTGQRPGECGRRIAGRDACPTQKGGLPPQRGVSASPSLTVPTTLFRIHCICPHCGQTWTQFIPLLPFALKSGLLGCPCRGFFAAGGSLKTQGERTKAPQGGWVLRPAPPCHPQRCCSEISGAELRSPTTAHKGPNTAFHPLGGVRATQPTEGADRKSVV